ncbi:MAG: adenosylmethionine--8-amino-7-oxononanoate transaminase [Zavarzinella sp.]
MSEMNRWLVVGTDTDAGKSTFCTLFLAAHATSWSYWKPVESGDSDSEKISRLVPDANVFPRHFHAPAALAPVLAARLAGKQLPTIDEVIQAVPKSHLPLLIESFGSPLSPWDEKTLQIEFLQHLSAHLILCVNSTVGAVGRCLQTLNVLQNMNLAASIVVIIGEHDPFAEEQIKHHSRLPVFSLQYPTDWSATGVQESVILQKRTLEEIATNISEMIPVGQVADDPSDRLGQLDRDIVWHPYTPLVVDEPPLLVRAAKNEYLYLADGRRIIDAISSWWTTFHGHCQPELMETLRRTTHKIDHVMFAGLTHEPAIAAADRLLKTTKWNGGRVFFSDNGSTAVEVAMKMAYQYWHMQDQAQRTTFITFENSYHGDTFGAMSISRDPVFFGRFEPFFFDVKQIPVDPAALEEFLATHHEHCAGLILEPLVQGAGGMKMHSPETLKQIAELANKYGVLFIADEVMTGGRTGKMWAHQNCEVVPDFICSGKIITGGVLPMAVTLVNSRVCEQFCIADRTKTFFHGHSYTANPLGCALIAKNLEIMVRGEWLRDSKRIEAKWLASVPRLAALPHVHDVRVCGTIIALDLQFPGGYLASIGPQIRRKCLADGVWIRPLGNVVYAMPPLCTSDSSLEQIATAMERSIKEININ